MIKEALEYIVGLKTPVITEIDDNTYSDKPLNRISYVPYRALCQRCHNRYDAKHRAETRRKAVE